MRIPRPILVGLFLVAAGGVEVMQMPPSWMTRLGRQPKDGPLSSCRDVPDDDPILFRGPFEVHVCDVNKEPTAVRVEYAVARAGMVWATHRQDEGLLARGLFVSHTSNAVASRGTFV